MSDDLVSEIRAVRFTPTRLREGYEMTDVDQFFDRLAAAASAGEPLGPLCEAARFDPVRLREGYDMGEVDEFLARIGGAAAAAPPAPNAPTTAEQASGVVEEQRGLLDRILHRD